MALMTVRGLKALELRQALTESQGRGAGMLRAVGTGGGRVSFYFRHTTSSGKQDDLPIGAWSERGGDGGITLAEARQRARKLSSRYTGGDHDLRLAIELARREAEQARKERERALSAQASREAATLGALLLAYVESLVRAGKSSARAVENSVRLHVERAFPTLWALPADLVTLEDLVEIVHRLVEAGSLTEARKVRGYLRAAFSAAVAARQSPSAPACLRSLKVTSNPARDLATVKGANRARERALSLAELRAYWARIQAREFAALRFHLLTGGQRIEQLARATMADWDRETQSLRLRDPKGRRDEARPHFVPLIPAALQALEEMDAGAIGPFLFTLTAGRSGADYSGLRKRLALVVASMSESGELAGGAFTLGDLRRTVETRLAAAGVPIEVRAHLQSHGLSGVQARHYVRHDYLPEKEQALRSLFEIVGKAERRVGRDKGTRKER